MRIAAHEDDVVHAEGKGDLEILRHDGHLARQRQAPDPGDVPAVDQDRAALRGQDLAEQPEERAFPRGVGPDDTQPLAGRGVERRPDQPLAGPIPERDLPDLDGGHHASVPRRRLRR